MRPGTPANPPSSTADAAGRPVITARVPTTAATCRRAWAAPRASEVPAATRPRSPGGAVTPVGTGRAHPVPPGPLPAQPGHQGRVEHERLRTVDEVVQQLVVAGRGHAKGIADLLLLGPERPPPAALKGEDPHLAFGQRRHLPSSTAPAASS